GKGNTPTQDVAEWNVANTGAQYNMHGIGSAASWSLPGGNPAIPATGPLGQQLGWIFGDQNIHVKDKDSWAQIDGDYGLEAGALTLLKFGARLNDHDRSSQGVIGQGPKGCCNAADPNSAFNPANWPVGYL